MQNLLHGYVTNHQGQFVYQTFFSGIAVCEKFVEDFQGDFLSITGVSKEYSEFSQKTPDNEWRCFWVFPGKPYEISFNICSLFECFVKCNKYMSHVFNSFIF